MAVFSTDVVAEILSRLAVKPLLRFRSVSKIWCAIIDSDYFIKSHLLHSIETRNHRMIILSSKSVDSISLDLPDVAVKLDHPLVNDNNNNNNYIMGSSSCNGLVLLWTFEFSDIVFWNPSTAKCQDLPCPKPKPQLYNGYAPYHQFCQIAYDSLNDDYKVVSLVQFRCFPNPVVSSDFQVYSMKSNSWRSIKDFPYCPCYEGQGRDGAFAHGALHWFVDIDDDNDEARSSGLSIAAFDVATEESRLVPLPDFGGGNDIKIYMDLVSLEGCLCIVAYHNPKFLGVWVMKEYGVGDSWDKLLSASHLSIMGSFSKIFPLSYSKNGREVLLLRDYKELIWFDIEDNAVRIMLVNLFSS